MPRPATGTFESHEWKDGRTVTWRLRVRYRGQRHRVDLGTNHEGWNEARARMELERVMGQIERGTWQPPTESLRKAGGIEDDETLHVTASRFWARRNGELAKNTQADYRWRLDFLLEFLATAVTAEMNVRRVDEFRAWLVARGLSARSVNMVLDLLAQVLDDAVDYELLDTNPARGRRRRMKVPKSRRTFLEADMVVDLLDEAGRWEQEVPPHQRYGRRALLATLCLGGPRISEATAAGLGSLDIHGGRLRVLDSKTDAGLRDIELVAYLTGEFRGHLASIDRELREEHGASLPIFHSRLGRALNASNIRNRLLAETVDRTNKRRAREGRMLLPDPVTPHTLRRTFVTLALAAGRDPRFVMGQVGHTDARLTLNLYAQIMQRQKQDEALIWSLMRFSHEPETRPLAGGFSPTNSPTSGGMPATAEVDNTGQGQ